MTLSMASIFFLGGGRRMVSCDGCRPQGIFASTVGRAAAAVAVQPPPPPPHGQ